MRKKSVLISIGSCGVVLGVICLISFCFQKPLISVVMASYNRVGFVSQAVESVLNQTETNFEFIIIDDASTDGTYEKLQAYAAKDKRIKLLRNTENQGLVYNLNKGLSMARGKYIARMDDDDMCEPDRFKIQVEFLDNRPDITVASSWIAPINSMTPYDFQKDTDWRRNAVLLYLGICPVSHPAVMMRRDFLVKHHIMYRPEFDSAEDRPFWGDIIDAGGRITVLPRVLLHYRMGHHKKEGYSSKQANNVYKFHSTYLKKFGGNIGRAKNRCEKLSYMIIMNKDKKLVDQEALEDIFEEKCPNLNFGRFSWPMPVKHTAWTDEFLFEAPNRLSRKNGDGGKIMMLTDSVLRLKWDRWAEEEFILKNGTWFVSTLMPQTIVIQHPDWVNQNEAHILGNRFVRANKDEATIIKKTSDMIAVKCDKWGEETFIKKGDKWILNRKK